MVRHRSVLALPDENDGRSWRRRANLVSTRRAATSSATSATRRDAGNARDRSSGPIFRPSIPSQERLGYPTQKPVALLERIISASSNQGDVVLDPFCGCGTTVHAAQKLGRQWIGIDITHLAIALIEKRLRDAFPGGRSSPPTASRRTSPARATSPRGQVSRVRKMGALADRRPARQPSKKGADRGLDGRLYFGAKTRGRASSSSRRVRMSASA